MIAKKRKPTIFVDAQQLRCRLMWFYTRIGKRKRISGKQLFLIMCDAEAIRWV